MYFFNVQFLLTLTVYKEIKPFSKNTKKTKRFLRAYIRDIHLKALKDDGILMVLKNKR